MPKQLTLGNQKPRDVMERVSLMQFGRVRLRETAAVPPQQAFGSLPLQRTRVWGPHHDRILLQVSNDLYWEPTTVAAILQF